MRQTAKKSSGKAKNSRKTAKKSSSPAKKIAIIAIVLVVLLAAAGFAYANNIRHQTPERIVSEDGVLHCYSKADEIMTGGWIEFEGKKYYAGEDGALYANRLEQIGEDGHFYFGEDGAMLTDIFIADEKVAGKSTTAKHTITREKACACHPARLKLTAKIMPSMLKESFARI